MVNSDKINKNKNNLINLPDLISVHVVNPELWREHSP